MSLTEFLAAKVAAGTCRIGQVVIEATAGGPPYRLYHEADAGLAADPQARTIEVFDGPARAREISTWSDDGQYRFAKAAANLRRGWIMLVQDAAELRQALDGLYPAAIGLWRALEQDTLDVQHLRDKLDRQTGMYRYARTISDAGAQQLVQTLCGPANQCAKRILWQLDANTPLADSEASRFNGLPPGTTPATAIPLLCREACNHFVAECRLAAKREFEQQRDAAT